MSQQLFTINKVILLLLFANVFLTFLRRKAAGYAHIILKTFSASSVSHTSTLIREWSSVIGHIFFVVQLKTKMIAVFISTSGP